MRPDDATVIRLRRHLGSVTAKYPRGWDQLAMFRRDKAQLGGWPAWCDVPLSGAYAVVSGGGDMPVNAVADVAVVGGLGAWRLTQGVYRFDPDLLEALWSTPIERVPTEMLYRLPEWCVYLETPGRGYDELLMQGAFLWLEWDTHPPHRTELRGLLDVDDGRLIPIMLHLEAQHLEACIEAALAESLRHMPPETQLPAGMWQRVKESFRGIWPPLLSLALYLCSEEPDITDERGAPGLPARSRPRKPDGTIIPASAPAAWVIGSRIGNVLRNALRGESAGGTHASPRAHWRRAHWHHYWTGPKSETQQLKLRWLHPILVAAGSDLPVTIHPVE